MGLEGAGYKRRGDGDLIGQWLGKEEIGGRRLEGCVKGGGLEGGGGGVCKEEEGDLKGGMKGGVGGLEGGYERRRRGT